MTDMKRLEEIKARQEKAWEMVFDLCASRREWIMSVPVRPDDDPNCVISSSLDDITELIERVKELEAQISHVDEVLSRRPALKLPEDAEKVVEEGLAGYDYLRMNVVTDPNAMTRIYAALSLLAPALARIKELEAENKTKTLAIGAASEAIHANELSDFQKLIAISCYLNATKELTQEEISKSSLLSPAPQPDPSGTGRS